MKVPNIIFNEANVGRTPISQNIRNRIGIVGEFSRGPANTPSFITGFTDFANRYGSDIKKGSLAFQAAYDQGAVDFSLIRVLGSSKLAKGNVTFSGVAEKVNTLLFHIKFLGEVIDRSTTPITAFISSSGSFVGTNSGRFYFRVTGISGVNATVKYVFLPLGTEPTNSLTGTLITVEEENSLKKVYINWSAITDSITVDVKNGKGVAVEVTDGLSLTFGIAGQTTDISLKVGDQFTVRADSYIYSIPINEGDLPNQIVTNFSSTVIGRSPIGEITRNTADNGAVFEVDPNYTGLLGNKFSYYFTLLDDQDPGITITPYGDEDSEFFQGGVEGPRNAVLDLYSKTGAPLLRLLAVSEGSWGNQLRVSVYPLSNKKFRLSIEDLNSSNFNPKLSPESYILDFTDVDANGFLNQLKNSIYVRGIFLPKFNSPLSYEVSLLETVPQRLAPPDSSITDLEDIRHPDYYGPTYLTNLSLENGYDGPPITESDYIAALGSFESQPVHIVLCAGQYNSPNIKAALITHAESAKELEGLRVAIINARPNVSVNAASQETIGFDSRRAVIVAGWSTYAGQPNAPRFGLSPDAIYAGKLASTPFFAGPNARRTSGPVFNVIEVDTIKVSTMSALQLLTDARLEILALDPATQNYVFTNGRTLSSDPAWEKIFIRRTYDIIRQDIYDLLQQYKAEPHTNLLRSQITSAINAYMGERLRNQQIANFSPSVADNSNNSANDYINGRLNISLSFLPLYAVDEIYITLIRDSGTGLVTFSN
ncbi:hypothetical protein H6G33_09340 [Calothrix sp. FACHB-1219]|uniref:phage tail sheath C-terminal domain-containing protein n=1 Tax=unclassified Calothrix TaxID=2619626 RepID=UPI0016848854|nr:MULTISPECIES: phage tail sheath C-terminal domain-containing protein [unclassified Calothrix]MBD2201549.1 hypothetical protein [Calothrix sp. FACHB-168]MBD2217235.1 hypothetical protein [Calothrix sp. FACHB-1219]